MVARARVQRFGLVLPPRYVGRYNSGTDQGARRCGGMARRAAAKYLETFDGTALWVGGQAPFLRRPSAPVLRGLRKADMLRADSDVVARPRLYVSWDGPGVDPQCERCCRRV